jgi:hypothetical protein
MYIRSKQMKKRTFSALVVIAACSFLTMAAIRVWPNALLQSQQFTTIEGESLKSKLEAAITSGHDQSRTRFWVAYSFDVRPRVTILEKGITVRAPGDIGVDTTRGEIFLLYQGNSIERFQIQNPDRAGIDRDIPGYWLGDAKTDESLELLGHIAEWSQRAKSDDSRVADTTFTSTPAVAVQAVTAIAVHNNPNVDTRLKQIARGQLSDIVRARAVSWLAAFGNEEKFLADFISDQRPDSMAALEAIKGLSQSNDDNVINQLKSLAISTDNVILATRVITSLSDNKGQQCAAILGDISRQAHSARARQVALQQLRRLNDQ